jgi:hypothetical protein
MLQAGLVEIIKPPRPVPQPPARQSAARQEILQEQGIDDPQSTAVKRRVVNRIIDRIRGL